LGKKFYNSLKFGQKNFSSAVQKLNNFKFCDICGYKKRHDNKFFFTLSFVAVLGSGIWDPRSGIWDPGSRMGKNQDLVSRIRDKHPGSATLYFSILL
jgi:hypothetical protein